MKGFAISLLALGLFISISTNGAESESPARQTIPPGLTAFFAELVEAIGGDVDTKPSAAMTELNKLIDWFSDKDVAFPVTLDAETVKEFSDQILKAIDDKKEEEIAHSLIQGNLQSVVLEKDETAGKARIRFQMKNPKIVLPAAIFDLEGIDPNRAPFLALNGSSEFVLTIARPTKPFQIVDWIGSANHRGIAGTIGGVERLSKSMEELCTSAGVENIRCYMGDKSPLSQKFKDYYANRAFEQNHLPILIELTGASLHNFPLEDDREKIHYLQNLSVSRIYLFPNLLTLVDLSKAEKKCYDFAVVDVEGTAHISLKTADYDLGLCPKL